MTTEQLVTLYRLAEMLDAGEITDEEYQSAASRIGSPRRKAESSDWNEDDHPRDDDGKFGSGSGEKKPDPKRDEYEKAKASHAERQKGRAAKKEAAEQLAKELSRFGDEIEAKLSAAVKTPTSDPSTWDDETKASVKAIPEKVKSAAKEAIAKAKERLGSLGLSEDDLAEATAQMDRAYAKLEKLSDRQAKAIEAAFEAEERLASMPPPGEEPVYSEPEPHEAYLKAKAEVERMDADSDIDADDPAYLAAHAALEKEEAKWEDAKDRAEAKHERALASWQRADERRDAAEAKASEAWSKAESIEDDLSEAAASLNVSIADAASDAKDAFHSMLDDEQEEDSEPAEPEEEEETEEEEDE